MKSIFVILATLALVHIARPDHADTGAKADTPDQAPQAAAPTSSNACNNKGEWTCTGKNTYRVCDNQGAAFDGTCDEGTECQVHPKDPKQIFCFKFIHHPYPTGPNGESSEPHKVIFKDGGSRLRLLRRRQAPVPSSTNPTCTNKGEWTCTGKTTYRVCDNQGYAFDGSCDEGTKCQRHPQIPNNIQCFKYIHRPYPTGPNGEVSQPLQIDGGSLLRRLRRNDDAQAVAPAQKSDDVQAAPASTNSCTNKGEWTCTGKTTYRVCDNQGTAFDGTCDEGSVCETHPNNPKQIHCFKFIPHPYQTGENGEMSNRQPHPAGQQAQQTNVEPKH